MISPNMQINSQGLTANMLTVVIHGGKDAALSYPVAPGYTALLIDEDIKMFFIKKNEINGTIQFREFKYEETTPANINDESSKYVTKEEFSVILNKLDRIEKAQNHRSNPRPRRNDNGKYYAKPDVR